MGRYLSAAAAAISSGQSEILEITAGFALQAGDLLAGSHYDTAPKPLFPRSMVPASYSAAKAPGDLAWSGLTTSMTSAFDRISVCPRADGGFAVLAGITSGNVANRLYVYSPDNKLLSSAVVAAVSDIRYFNNGDNNGGLAELKNGGFVYAGTGDSGFQTSSLNGGSGYYGIVYPFGGGTDTGATNLGAAYGVSVCAAADGGFYLLVNAYQPYFAKYNAAGVQQWNKLNVGGGSNHNRAVIELANGNVALIYGSSGSGSYFAIYDPSGTVVVAPKSIPGVLGNEVTAAPLAGGGFVVASRTMATVGSGVAGSNYQHTILSDAGAVVVQRASPEQGWGGLRGVPSGGYIASIGTGYFGYSNSGQPSYAYGGAYYPLPLADGKIADIRLNTASSQIVTTVYAGTGVVYGVSLDTVPAGGKARMLVSGTAALRLPWLDGGFNHNNKAPVGTRGLIAGQSAILWGIDA